MDHMGRTHVTGPALASSSSTERLPESTRPDTAGGMLAHGRGAISPRSHQGTGPSPSLPARPAPVAPLGLHSVHHTPPPTRSARSKCAGGDRTLGRKGHHLPDPGPGLCSCSLDTSVWGPKVPRAGAWDPPRWGWSSARSQRTPLPVSGRNPQPGRRTGLGLGSGLSSGCSHSSVCDWGRGHLWLGQDQSTAVVASQPGAGIRAQPGQCVFAPRSSK